MWSDNPDDWWDVKAPLYEERRYSHGEGCIKEGASSSDSRGRLYVRRIPEGWRWYCHNCGQGGVRKFTSKEIGAFLDASQSNSIGTAKDKVQSNRFVKERFRLPEASREHLPDAVLEWLYGYGLDDFDFEDFRWWPSTERLIMPIYHPSRFENSKLVGYQARYFGTQKNLPKYITAKETKDTQLYYKLLRPGTKPTRYVLVEDIVSALRCYNASKSSGLCGHMALLGSPRNPPSYVLELERTEGVDELLVWLDLDKAKVAAHWAHYINSMTNMKARAIVSDLDPKAYSPEDIRRYIEEPEESRLRWRVKE